MSALNKRLSALELGNTHLPHCWVQAEGAETSDQAIKRHKLREGCIENSGGHIVWMEKELAQ